MAAVQPKEVADLPIITDFGFSDGRDRFGEPSAKIVALLDAVTDLSRLEGLLIRLLQVKTWEELLGVNGTTRHPRGRRKV